MLKLVWLVLTPSPTQMTRINSLIFSGTCIDASNKRATNVTKTKLTNPEAE